MSDEIKDTFPRFVAHWVAATFGFFLRGFLPVVLAWTNPSTEVEYPRWWAAFLFAALVSFPAGIINSDLPTKPRQLLKSIGLGFALDAALVLAKVSPL